MTIKIVIWVRKMDINLEAFKITNMDRIEELVLILFEDNKASIQFGKGIPNTGKIKYINIIFYEVKDEFRKSIIFFQQMPDNQKLIDRFTKPFLHVAFEMAYEKIKVCNMREN